MDSSQHGNSHHPGLSQETGSGHHPNNEDQPANVPNLSQEREAADIWLDMTSDNEMDDDESDNGPQIGDILKKLIRSARRHKSFSALYKLEAVKNYLELKLKYSLNPKVKNPRTRASLAVAKSVGKGPYFARKLRHLALYIQKFHTLPPTNSGNHHAHPSLLDNEQVAHAVRRYLTVVADGEVRNYHVYIFTLLITERCTFMHRLRRFCSKSKSIQ